MDRYRRLVAQWRRRRDMVTSALATTTTMKAPEELQVFIGPATYASMGINCLADTKKGHLLRKNTGEEGVSAKWAPDRAPRPQS